MSFRIPRTGETPAPEGCGSCLLDGAFRAGLESFSAGASALLGFLVVGSLGTGLAAGAYGLARGRRVWWKVGLVLVVLPLCASLTSSFVARQQRQRTFDQGERLVTGLELYRQARGGYPVDLKELVPEYLTEVPATSMGIIRRVGYGYHRDPERGYRISFPAPAWIICSRTAKSDWQCDD
jgi:hypothetical protein